MAALEVPLADAAASPVPVSADYYYRIPVRPIYKAYPVYHPSKEPSDYFERLKTLEPQIVRIDSSTMRTENDWIRAGEIVDLTLGIFSEVDQGVVLATEYLGDIFLGSQLVRQFFRRVGPGQRDGECRCNER